MFWHLQRTRRVITNSLVVIATTLFGAQAASAHEVTAGGWLSTPYPPLERGERFVGSVDPIKPRVVEGVFDMMKLWQAGSTVEACFMAGSNTVRSAFVSAASEWLNDANLELDFGAAPSFRTCSRQQPSPIRVTFDYNDPVDKNYSYVGTDSLRSDRNLPSMNVTNGLSSDLRIVDAEDFKGTVLHEVGHALAMEHEHQHPDAGCDEEFDWDRVYARFAQYGWDEAKVNRNLRAMILTVRLRTTEYDPASIMHYSLEPWMFKGGRSNRCWVPEAKTLSALDRQTIREAYPQDVRGQTDLVVKRADFGKEVLSRLGFSAAQKERLGEAATEIVKATFPNMKVNFLTATTYGACSPVVQNTGSATISLTVTCTNVPPVELAAINERIARLGTDLNERIEAANRLATEYIRGSSELAFVDRQISELYAPLAAEIRQGDAVWQQFLTEFERAHGRRQPVRYRMVTDGGRRVAQPIPLTVAEWQTWLDWVRREFKPHNDRLADLITSKAALYEGGKLPDCFRLFLRHKAAFDENFRRATQPGSPRIWNPDQNWPFCFNAQVEEDLAKLTAKRAELQSRTRLASRS